MSRRVFEQAELISGLVTYSERGRCEDWFARDVGTRGRTWVEADLEDFDVGSTFGWLAGLRDAGALTNHQFELTREELARERR